MDSTPPAPPPPPVAALHRNPSSSSSPSFPRPQLSPRRSHARDATEDGLPTRFRRGSGASSLSGAGAGSRDEWLAREQLVNSYEQEEERLVNALGRRMEEMREETTHLHNAMEGEAEALVLKLQRQVQSLQAQLAAAHGSSPNLSSSTPSSSFAPPLPAHGLPALGSPVLPPAASLGALVGGGDPLKPDERRVLEALRGENESLRARLSDAERGFIHVCRQNDVYREELISLRQRLNLPYQDLILPPASPAPSQNSGSPSLSFPTSPLVLPHGVHRPSSSASSSAAAARSPRLSTGVLGSARSGHRQSSSSSSSAVSTTLLVDPDGPAGSAHPSAPLSPALAPGLDRAASPEVERRLSLSAPGGERPSFRVAERGVLRRVGSGASAGGNEPQRSGE